MVERAQWLGREPATIDLGELREDTEPGQYDRLLPRAVARWWRRVPPATVRRTVAMASVTVLLGAAMAGAGRPEPWLTDVLSAPLGAWGDFQIVGDTLVVVRAGDLGASLAAYRLVGGVRLWEVALGAATGHDTYGGMFVDRSGRVVVGAQNEGSVSTEVYDLRTGARLWRRPGGSRFGGVTDDMVFVELPQPCPDPETCGQELTGVDGRTGEARWRLRVPPGLLYATSFDIEIPSPGATPRLATVDRVGTLTTYDVRTGAVTGRRAIAPMESQRSMQILADRLIVQVPEGIAAFDTLLNPLWTVELALAEWSGVGWPCGRLLCVATPDGTSAVDPTTGMIPWELPGRAVLGTVGDRHALTYQMRNGTVEIYPWAETEVIALETGQRLWTTRSWEPLGPQDGQPNPRLQRWNDGRTRVWLGELSLNPGGVRTVASLSGVRDYCILEPPFLACHAVPDQVRVWRLPAAP